jgi:hypothetical protein
MFQEFAPFFGPEDLESMGTAFDAVWLQLVVAGVLVGPVTKKKLAQVILAAACTGERSRERLKDVALRALQPKKNPLTPSRRSLGRSW